MTIYDFLLLNEQEQMAQVMLHGTFVTKVKRERRIYALYSLNTFFYELEYEGFSESPGHEAILICTNIFRSGSKINKYLENSLLFK